MHRTVSAVLTAALLLSLPATAGAKSKAPAVTPTPHVCANGGVWVPKRTKSGKLTGVCKKK